MNVEDLPLKYQAQAKRKLKEQNRTAAERMMQPRAKYGNRKAEVDGITFDSKKEAGYYLKLKALEEAGEITQIILQPRFELQPAFDKNGKHYRKIEYVADFMYTSKAGETFVIDVKGMRTDVYKQKKKMFEYRFPNLTITEV